jgi:hypothetical protein
MVTIAERVARGAALLDDNRPGWWQDPRLDAATIDSISTCDCVLGQLFDDEDEEEDDVLASDGYWVALEELGLGHSADEAVEGSAGWYGFASRTISDYRPLDAAWRELIEARRSA